MKESGGAAKMEVHHKEGPVAMLLQEYEAEGRLPKGATAAFRFLDSVSS